MFRFRVDDVGDPAHLRIEKVANRFVLPETFNRHLGAGTAARGLDQNARQPEPALDDVGTEMNVLDARVVEDDLSPEEPPPTHRDSFFGEGVAQRGVTNPTQKHDQREKRSGKNRAQSVVRQQGPVRSLDSAYRGLVDSGNHREGSKRRTRSSWTDAPNGS